MLTYHTRRLAGELHAYDHLRKQDHRSSCHLSNGFHPSPDSPGSRLQESSLVVLAMQHFGQRDEAQRYLRGEDIGQERCKQAPNKSVSRVLSRCPKGRTRPQSKAPVKIDAEIEDWT